LYKIQFVYAFVQSTCFPFLALKVSGAARSI
jgi:hypothetical protein